jgi:hypothetical protein
MEQLRADIVVLAPLHVLKISPLRFRLHLQKSETLPLSWRESQRESVRK